MRAIAYSLLIGLLSFTFNARAGEVKGKYFNRIMFVIFENTNYADAIKQPFLKSLSEEGVNLTNLHAETHPSQGNYVALTSRSVNGVRNDNNIDLDVSNIADLLDAKGISWKAYAEDYPGNCFLKPQSGNYARKHIPFLSYINIQNDSNRCAKIVNADEFATDFSSGNLPQYVFYIPNQKNDAHDTGVAFADKWYEKTFSPYFKNPKFLSQTVVVSTFDENSKLPGNQIYASLIGSVVKPHTVISDNLNHYSLLKLVEENWDLGNLGKEDVGAPVIQAIWN